MSNWNMQFLVCFLTAVPGQYFPRRGNKPLPRKLSVAQRIPELNMVLHPVYVEAQKVCMIQSFSLFAFTVKTSIACTFYCCELNHFNHEKKDIFFETLV